jgi:hypothetical protein
MACSLSVRFLVFVNIAHVHEDLGVHALQWGKVIAAVTSD